MNLYPEPMLAFIAFLPNEWSFLCSSSYLFLISQNFSPSAYFNFHSMRFLVLSVHSMSLLYPLWATFATESSSLSLFDGHYWVFDSSDSDSAGGQLFISWGCSLSQYGYSILKAMATQIKNIQVSCILSSRSLRLAQRQYHLVHLYSCGIYLRLRSQRLRGRIDRFYLLTQ